MVAPVLESRDLTRPQARLATSYRPGDIVVFRKAERGRPRAGIGHRVEPVDTATGTVRLRPDKRARQRAESKPVDWQPARWGADVAEAFTEVAQEFRTGDRTQFTRNNYRADRLNGQTAEVVAIDTQGASMVLERSARTAPARCSTCATSPTGISGPVGFAPSIPRRGRRAIGSWPTSKRSAPIPSTHAPSMSRSVAPDTARPSIPTIAPASLKLSASATAHRSAPSTRR